MGEPVYRQKNTYMRRCDKCHKQSHYIYHMNLGGVPYNFCSGMCADAARKEFEEKQKLGITPINEEPITDSLEDGGDI